MDSFTYIIRSDNKYSGTPNNCQIQLGGLPTKFKSFLVETIGYYADGGMNIYFEIYSDNIPIKNGYDTKNKSLHVLYSSICNINSMVYKIDNFNGQYINFKILNEANTIIPDITDWTLYLKMTGIEE